MRYIIIAILVSIGINSYGQSIVPFATGRTTDTGATPGSLKAGRYLVLPYYYNAADTATKYLSIGARGRVVLRTPAGGSSVDTARIYDSIAMLSARGLPQVLATKDSSNRNQLIRLGDGNSTGSYHGVIHNSTSVFGVNGFGVSTNLLRFGFRMVGGSSSGYGEFLLGTSNDADTCFIKGDSITRNVITRVPKAGGFIQTDSTVATTLLGYLKYTDTAGSGVIVTTADLNTGLAGKVTSVTAGAAMTGGTITSTGTINLNTASVAVNRPIFFNGSVLTTTATGTPTIAAGAGAGTGPTVSIDGDDMTGNITITTGSTPTLGATVATITFSSAYAAAPKCVIVVPADENAAVLLKASTPFAPQSSITTTTFILKQPTAATGALVAATTYKFYYHVQ